MNRFFRNIFFIMLFILASFSAMIPSVIHAAANPTTVYCYVSVDDHWIQVDELKISDDTNLFGGQYKRFYITLDKLEQIYGEYGFKKDSYNGEMIFPHTDSYGPGTIWADTPAKKNVSGDYIIPLGQNRDNRDKTYLYYLPNGPVTSAGKTVTKFQKDNSDNLNINKKNSFYSVAAEDNGYLSDADKAKLPEKSYMLSGSSREIVLPYAEGISYMAANASSKNTLDLPQTIDKDKKTVTIKIDKISCPILISTYKPDEAVITCYVAVDGQWNTVRTYTTTATKKFGNESGKERFYVTSDELENIYGGYGFKASGYDGSRLFPHTDSGDNANLIWADMAPEKNSSGGYDIPLSHRKIISLYYLPANKQGSDSYFDQSKKSYDETMLSENSFYTVKFSDTKGLLPVGKTLPGNMMLFSGSSKEITLPKLKDPNRYKIVDGNTGNYLNLDIKTDDSSDTVTVSIKNISCPVRVYTTSGLPTVVYNAGLQQSLTKLGQFAAPAQKVYKDGTVKNKTQYYDERITLELPYVALDVDDDIAISALSGDTSSTKNRRFAYTFTGWRIGSSDTVYQAGDVIPASELEKYADDSNEVALTAVWKATDSKARVGSVNFYVNLDCEISDNLSDGFVTVHSDKFTDSIFTTRAINTDNVPGTGDYQLIAPPNAGSDAYEVDSKIRASSREPLQYGVMVEQMPSDEEVLAHIREGSYTITLDGKKIPNERITSEYFTVRWYVLKYEHSDGWHVDGVLVAKEGKITITKSFAGDSEAIKTVKDNGFGISVTHEESGKSVSDYELSLDPAGSETDDKKTGYTSYDESSDTYTWILTARQERTYLIKEKNYMLDTDKWNHTNGYSISNSSDETNGWRLYSDNEGVSVTTEAYPSDVPAKSYQTVALKNIYVQAGLVTVSKVDSITGNGLKNVSFKLSLASGDDLLLYRKPGTSEYSTDTNAEKDGYTERVLDNMITTDSSGMFFVKLGIFGDDNQKEEYILKENVPLGYDGPKQIKLTITDDGTIETAEEVTDSTISSKESWLEGTGTSVLTIKNRSKLLTSVKAVKNWNVSDGEEKEPVTMELWRNGAKINDPLYTQVLNEDNNWQYEWKDLPLYIDGELAEYTLKESKIGSTSYDPNTDEDGYEDYIVTSDTPLYREGDDGDYQKYATWYDADGEWHYADNILLKINNVKNKGIISFSKVDEANDPVTGAKFGLYSDASCSEDKLLDTAVSGKDGFVMFPQRSGGTYYIKETEAPKYYALDDMVYKVVVKGGIATITKNDGSTAPVTKIVNKYTGGTEDFNFIKSDSSKAPLGGAGFALFRLKCTDETHTYHHSEILQVDSKGELPEISKDCWELVSTDTSKSSSGSVSFSKLNAKATYRLVEYITPDGYKPPSGQWELKFDTSTDPVEPVITAIGDKVPAFEKQDKNAQYRLYNYSCDNLPSAGSPGIFIYILAGLAMMTAGLAIVIYRIVMFRRSQD